MKTRIYLETECRQGKNRIRDLYSEAPYKFMSPDGENGNLEIIQMSASPGMLSGDSVEMSLFLREGSAMTYLTQSYEKIFASKGNPARKNVQITMEKNTALTYLPFPVIPFAGSDYESSTIVNMTEGCHLFYGEIFNCGRVGMREKFQMKNFRSRTRVYFNHRLIFADHTLICPQQYRYTRAGFWHDFTHCGLLFYYGKKDGDLIRWIRENRYSGLETGCSRAVGGVSVRIAGRSGDQIYQYMKQIADSAEPAV